MKLRYAVALAGVALVVGAFVGVGLPQRAHALADETQRTITVTGTGTLNAVPDLATLSFGVTTRADTAGGALAANSATMRKVIAVLKGAGVASKDLQTSQVSISPDYNDQDTAIIGFQASNSVNVVVRVLGRAGALIDAAVNAGANQVDGPTLQRSNQGELARKALSLAVTDARANAEAIATAAGLALGKVVTVNVDQAAPPVGYAQATKSAAPEDTPIEPGTQSIQAVVTVTFEVT